MTLWMVMLGALIGCGSSTPEPTPGETPAASARGKGKHKGKGRKAKRRRRARGKAPQLKPVGASGDVFGKLVLTQVEEPGRKPNPTVAPAAGTAEGTDAAGTAAKATPEATAGTEAAGTEAADTDAAGTETAGTPMVTRTKAELQLRWGTDGTQTVGLGKVRGTCTESDPKPVGPPGKEKTPLWTVRCEDGTNTLDLFILQVGPRISVVRETPGATPDAPKVFKPVKRIPLVEGATLKRES